MTLFYNPFDIPMRTPYLIHPITLHPHVPYFGMKDKLEIEVSNKMSAEGRRLLDYVLYMDSYFEAFIELFKKTQNSIFIFYSDHGATGYHKKDLEIILGRELSELEYQKELRHINAFIYVPDDYDGPSIKPGLFKGSQPLVRSQIDLYRTTLELFGVESQYHYYGVNALSNERTFVLDPKTLLLITDEYMINSLNFHKKNKDGKDIVYFRDDVSLDPKELYLYALKYKQFLDSITLNRQHHLLH